MKIIDKAIELLRTKGWIRGAEHTPDGYCLRGALQAATIAEFGGGKVVTEREFHRVMNACVRQIKRRTSGSFADIPLWNDKKATDCDEVIEVLKLAGEDLDREEELRRSLPLPENVVDAAQ